MAFLALRRWFLPLLLALLTGCAGLPQGVERVPSSAIDDVAATRLAEVALASLGEQEEGAARSGLRLLPAGDQALEARLAIVRLAQRSVDAQYYQIADDASGRQFLRELRDAGARGVRVLSLIHI